MGKLIGQVARFGVSGAINTLVYVGCGKALLEAGAGHAITGAVALLAASATGYGLHKLFSFRSRSDGRSQAVKYAMLVCANTILSSAALPALAKQLGLSDTAALLSLSLVLPFSNFLAMRLWVFKPRSTRTAVTA